MEILWALQKSIQNFLSHIAYEIEYKCIQERTTKQPLWSWLKCNNVCLYMCVYEWPYTPQRDSSV